MLDTLPTDLQNIVKDFARPRTTTELVVMLKETADGIMPERDGFTQDFFKWCMKEYKSGNDHELVTWVPQGEVETKRLHRAYKFFDWLQD